MADACQRLTIDSAVATERTVERSVERIVCQRLTIDSAVATRPLLVAFGTPSSASDSPSIQPLRRSAPGESVFGWPRASDSPSIQPLRRGISVLSCGCMSMCQRLTIDSAVATKGIWGVPSQQPSCQRLTIDSAVATWQTLKSLFVPHPSDSPSIQPLRPVSRVVPFPWPCVPATHHRFSRCDVDGCGLMIVPPRCQRLTIDSAVATLETFLR